MSNSFGELFAICKSYFILKHFNIKTENRRTVIMTDSLSSFCPFITPPKNIKKQIKFPSLFRETQKYVKRLNVILWKIKSHTDKINIIENYFNAAPRVQPYNGEADSLADIGRLHPHNKPGIPIHINSINNPHYYYVNKCLNGANNFHIVRQFWLRRISESAWPD